MRSTVSAGFRLMVVAGSQGQGGEQENRKNRTSFAAIHVAPHDRIVCVCPPGKENAHDSHLRMLRAGRAGWHRKSRQGAQLLNALNQERYSAQPPAGGPLTE